MIPRSHTDILDKKGFAHVATLGPDGEPQSNPVWYDWNGEHLLFSSTLGRQKFKNLQNDPRVAVSILDPDNPYRYLEIRGFVSDIEPDDDEQLIHSLSHKYMGKDYPDPGDDRVVVKIKPSHTTTMG